MPQLPKLTVITPSLNQGEYIETTIQSVLGQAYPALEYLVIDGGSTDRTLPILRRYEGQLQWCSEKDRGQSDALNKGFRQASGDIIAYLNADDLYEPGALLTVGHFFAQHPDVYWLTGRCHIVDHEGNKIRGAITLYKDLWLRCASYRLLQILNFISQPATFWRREVWETVGSLDAELHYAMDYDYWLRIGQRYRLATIRACLARFRMHAASKSGSSASQTFAVELDVLRRYSPSPFLLGMHRLHSLLIVYTYRRLLQREQARVAISPGIP